MMGLSDIPMVVLFGPTNSDKFAPKNNYTKILDSKKIHGTKDIESISVDEAYKILNLNPKKKYSKEEVMKSYKNIMKKIHPDVSPDLSRLAAIVNEAKEIVLKDVS